MPVHEQDCGRAYAYCRCGVCGPLRARVVDAEADDAAHGEVCLVSGDPEVVGDV